MEGRTRVIVDALHVASHIHLQHQYLNVAAFTMAGGVEVG